MKNTILLIITLIIQAFSLPLLAQDHLKLKTIFDKYGKLEGSVLVQLSDDILSQGSRITFYKSLIMDESDSRMQATRQAIEADIKNGTKIAELLKNGRLESGTYLINTRPNSSNNEYILYKQKSKKITLVYLQGRFHPQELENELKSLKDLFIYVNNRRLKIQ